MNSNDVISIYQLLKANGVTIWIDGGWAVDALLGSQTREHNDLDVVVQWKDMTALRDLLQSLGFIEKGEAHARPHNFILVDGRGREMDLHLVELDAAGNGVYGDDRGENYTRHALSGTGTIAGTAVRCIAPDVLVRFHTGYVFDADDVRDVTALCDRFGLEMPAEYREAVAETQLSN